MTQARASERRYDHIRNQEGGGDDSGFDPLVVATDWLDACKARRLADVIDFFAEDATLVCACAGDGIFIGRDDLETYWRPRLADPSPTLFEFEQVWLDATGASLAYRGHDRKIIRIHFSFNDLGKIEWSRCAVAT